MSWLQAIFDAKMLTAVGGRQTHLILPKISTLCNQHRGLSSHFACPLIDCIPRKGRMSSYGRNDGSL